MQDESEAKPAGRPKDQAVGEALKRAALELVRAEGYGAVSISAIIARAGVSRQSLYNRWATKAELVMEALFEDAEIFVPEPAAEADPRAALVDFFDTAFRHLAANGYSLRSLIASAQEDPAFRAIFLERFVAPRDAIVVRLLQRAQAQGLLAPEADVEMLSSLAHGAFWYWLLTGRPLDRALAERIVASILGAAPPI